MEIKYVQVFAQKNVCPILVAIATNSEADHYTAKALGIQIMNGNFLNQPGICVSDHGNPDNKKIILRKNGFTILQCNVCGLRYASPEEYEKHLEAFSDDYFFNGKDGYPNYLEESDILYQSGVRYSKLISRYMPNPGKMVDVGAAAGFIQKGFADSA